MHSKKQNILFQIAELLTIFSFLYIVFEGAHDCVGSECLICTRISLCNMFLLSMNLLFIETRNIILDIHSYIAFCAWKLEGLVKVQKETDAEILAIIHNLLSSIVINYDDFLSCFYSVSLVNQKVRMNN